MRKEYKCHIRPSDVLVVLRRACNNEEVMQIRTLNESDPRIGPAVVFNKRRLGQLITYLKRCHGKMK